jgi:hypothetical protein
VPNQKSFFPHPETEMASADSWRTATGVAIVGTLYAYLIWKSKEEVRLDAALTKARRKARKNAKRVAKKSAERASVFDLATRKADADLEEQMEDSPFNDSHWQEGLICTLEEGNGREEGREGGRTCVVLF